MIFFHWAQTAVAGLLRKFLHFPFKKLIDGKYP
jgi:hypothetical protein